MNGTRNLLALAAMLSTAPLLPAAANVVTDWDEIAVRTVQPTAPVAGINVALGLRNIAMVHIAMFTAVNCIEPRYRDYKTQMEPQPGTSQDAGAASAAANVLLAVIPMSSKVIQTALDEYLAKIPPSEAKDRGIKMGREVATKVVAMRADDGTNARNAYRPVTQPGVYVPTAFTVGWEMIETTPFVMTTPAQFRPGPPVDLNSEQWARDYNEIKAVGEKASKLRTQRQTEDAQFWLTTGAPATQPIVRQIVDAKKMSIVDSARFMAVTSAAQADAFQAVQDAKWHYTFWRPMTAIRNGDIDGNSATERDPTWEPIGLTPLHPEYPCAHCIISTASATAMKAMLGSSEIPEVALTMPTAPGVTHRFTNLDDYNTEIANARIYAGFHYRTSTVVGQEMGRKIGEYMVQTVMQPL